MLIMNTKPFYLAVASVMLLLAGCTPVTISPGVPATAIPVATAAVSQPVTPGIPPEAVAQPTLPTSSKSRPTQDAPNPTYTALPGAIAPAKPQAQTPALTEGPFYKANPPQRNDMREPNTTGETLIVTGRVLDTQGQPIANARVDIWHDDEKGVYDNVGYRYRGYVLTNANGDYSMTTITPALYPGRTWHIHVKIVQPGGKTLTTQLFSAGYTKQNAEDGIFDARLLGAESTSAQGRQLAYTFVVARA